MPKTRLDGLALAAAVCAVLLSLLDLIGLLAGWGAKFTPLLLGVLLWHSVSAHQNIDRLRPMIRKIERRMEGLQRSAAPNTPAHKKAKTKKEHGAVITMRTYDWKGLSFSSKSEIKIAQALDRQKVLFFPNCVARLPNSYVKRETDFLIFHQGQWGILEVDGPHHMAKYDGERDRAFYEHGIAHIRRYPSNRCYNAPHEVVREFLNSLPPARDTRRPVEPPQNTALLSAAAPEEAPPPAD
ncbi:MAG: hypothetical protein HXY40_15890 [Chloroflexi bacterium]|nr:hypothetical protein [Chloroflexota bacterium]